MVIKNSPQWQLEHFIVPSKFRDISWAALTDIPQHDIDYARNYVDKFPYLEKRSLYFWSELSGTGKTGLSICITRDLILKGKIDSYALFFSDDILMDRMRQDLGPFTISHLFAKIMRSSFLVIDDIGVKKLSRSAAERYYTLLNQLWGNEIPGIFTSKFGIRKLVNRADEDVDFEMLTSIGSRLVGMCDERELGTKVDHRTK